MPADLHQTVLILARDHDTANDVGMLVRSVGCVALTPRGDEGGLAAVFRLRPSVVMVQSGRDELASDRLDAIAHAIGAGVVVFGDDSPELRETARRHGGRSIALDAPTREFGSVIEGAAGA